jgi:hypothetical protein
MKFCDGTRRNIAVKNGAMPTSTHHRSADVILRNEIINAGFFLLMFPENETVATYSGIQER